MAAALGITLRIIGANHVTGFGLRGTIARRFGHERLVVGTDEGFSQPPAGGGLLADVFCLRFYLCQRTLHLGLIWLGLADQLAFGGDKQRSGKGVRGKRGLFIPLSAVGYKRHLHRGELCAGGRSSSSERKQHGHE